MRQHVLLVAVTVLVALSLACFNPPPAERPRTCGIVPVYEERNGRKVQTGTEYACDDAAPRATGGPVHVRGYYRRDGTYVRPHTRRR